MKTVQKTVQKTVNVYDVGDILDIENIEIRNYKREEIIGSAKRVIVISRKEKINGDFSYGAITDSCKHIVLKAQEVEYAKYIGAIDLSLLFGSNES